ncbi:MAG: SsrA-binding protein SmpB [Clostridiales bacterium]|nr:SsrA-binding protein SmpB [Clostridiales bacterium]
MEDKTICTNRAATHQYFILDRYEAGIVLEGSEVKSLRLNNVNLKDSFCLVHNGELFIKNMHIALYDKAGAFSTRDSRRDRKLLLHRDEIIKLNSKVAQKGLTLVPLRLYFKQSLIKLELGLCQGKHTYDKKQSLMEKDRKREKERELKNYR